MNKVLAAVAAVFVVGSMASGAHAECRKLTREVPKKAPAAAVAAQNEAVLARVRAGTLEGEELEWKHLVVHHTASEYSNVARIHRFHCKKFEDPDGIEYHFLIGNGRNMPDGYIAEGRWPLQKRSIHLFHPERAPGGIAIAMVGNFEERRPTRRQVEALTSLLTALAVRYEIPADRITTHRLVDGRLTQCPGKKLPFEKILARVQKARVAPGPATEPALR